MTKEVKVNDLTTLKGRIHSKFESAKEGVKKAAKKTAAWVEDNKELAIAIVTVGIPTITKTTKAIAGCVEQHREDREFRKRVWDPATGIRWYLKRPMSVKEQLEYERRWQSGEPRGDILRSMHLI